MLRVRCRPAVRHLFQHIVTLALGVHRDRSIFFPHLPVGAPTQDRGDMAQPAEMSTLPPEA